MSKMNIFYGASWSIELYPEWVSEQDDPCVSIYHPDGVGALQISPFNKDSKIASHDLRDLASDHITEGMDVDTIQAGEFSGITLASFEDEKFLQCWFVVANKTALFVTYNCDKADSELENDAVKKMIASLRYRSAAITKDDVNCIT